MWAVFFIGVILVLSVQLLYYTCVVKGILLYICDNFGEEKMPDAKTVVDYANLAVLKSLKLR